MRLSLWPTVDFIREEDLKDKIVVVIDVLRATSVITTALNNGAEYIKVTVEVDEALKLKDEGNLIGGERNALKIEGFDLSNSPLEYKREVVEDKIIVLTTTNGTKTIHKSLGAERIYIGSVLNGMSVAKRLVKDDRDTVVICAGTRGKFSLDDFICAGKIISDVIENKNIEADDFAAAAYMAYRDNRGNLLNYVKMASHYKYLCSIGLEEDVKYCFTEDIINIVPEYRDGKIIISTK
jgi:2-phosphosulfolactate phosphatase